MKLASLLSLTRIALDVEASTRDEVLALAARQLCGDDSPRCDSVRDALLHRESMGGTGIGEGVAVPHGRVEDLGDARAAFLQLRRPVVFEAPDDTPVDLVIALAVPADFTLQHLNLLADIATHCAQAEVRDRLRAARDAHAVLDVLI